MDRLFKPEKFDTLPEDTESTKIFNYWLHIFEGFIATVAGNPGENEEINKLALLTHYSTHKTYSFIAEAATYDEAKTSLTRAYRKQKNVVFARHLLMTRTQRPGESIAEYVHFLRVLARDCDFVQVTAEQYRDEFTRDAFINGLASSSIRQRLLEVDGIDFKTAIERAEILNRGQHQSVFYSATSTYSATATKQDLEPDSSHPSSPALARLTTRKKRILQCYFCVDALHTGGRKQCPAKDERCHKCGKVGHFQKVCQSEERKLFAASASTSLSLDKQGTSSTDQTPFLLSILAGVPSSLKGIVVPCSLNGLLFDSLLDPGASNNFVNKKVAESLGLKPQGGTSVVSMASGKLNAPILGQISGNL